MVVCIVIYFILFQYNSFVHGHEGLTLMMLHRHRKSLF